MVVNIKSERGIRHCEDELGRRCSHDTNKTCNCSVATGNPELPNLFEVKS